MNFNRLLAGALLLSVTLSASAVTKIPASMLDADVPTAAQVNAKANDSAVVHNTGAETIAGIKTFSSQPVLPQALTARTSIATTSGTTADFTGIPSWVKRITVMVAGFSHASGANAQLIIQLGDSGGVETTGYLSAAAITLNGNTTGAGALTTGLQITGDITAAAVVDAAVYTIVNVSGNLWVGSGTGANNSSVGIYTSGGSKTLSPGPLDRVRITTNTGATFDAGSVNIFYE